jgi:hypothetical protein
MPTVRVLNVDRALTLHLYRAPDEQNLPDDLRGGLCNIGLEVRVSRQNPATDDIWRLGVDLARHHGQLAATGTALFGILTLWLKQRKGRRVEIERPGLKVKAPSAHELQKALSALHDYDELTLTLNRGKLLKRARKKKGAPRTPRNLR